jgi:hypothetical protein
VLKLRRLNNFLKCFKAFLPHLCLVFLFVSCASAPKLSLPAGDKAVELSLLPSGAKLYLWADAVEGRPLLDVLPFAGFSIKDAIETKQAAQVLDNTLAAAAALYEEGASGGRRFFLVSSGKYPRFGANLSFAFSKDWKKLKSPTGNSYWYSKSNDIALAIGAKTALISNIDPFMDFIFEEPPLDFMEFSHGLVLAGWVNEPSQFMDGFLASMGIPLQLPADAFFFGALRTINEVKPWELIFKIKLPSSAQARSLLALFSMARLFVLQAVGAKNGSEETEFLSAEQAAALLLANPLQAEGEYIIIRTSALSEVEIALLFNLFPIYSD